MHPSSYVRPTTFDEALQALAPSDATALPFAGATDIIPLIRDGALRPDLVVDIKGLPGMRDLRVVAPGPACASAPASCLVIGAAVRINEVARSALVRSQWGLLALAAASLGNEQVRNRATIGGNICTASPAADTAPALYALEAIVLIKGPDGDRSLPIAQFFTGPRSNALKRGELVTGLLIPEVPAGTEFYHEKLSRRRAGDLAIASVAAMASPAGDTYEWRIALGAVGPTPLRSPESEAILRDSLDDEAIDRAAASAYGCCCPISDIRAGQEYRQAMVINLSRRVIKRIIANLPTVGV
jgi:CO/xanthine dehydrogenase FAD-binding subunit